MPPSSSAAALELELCLLAAERQGQLDLATLRTAYAGVAAAHSPDPAPRQLPLALLVRLLRRLPPELGQRTSLWLVPSLQPFVVAPLPGCAP